MLRKPTKAGGGLIYLCNPNNPTSSLTPSEDIQWLVNNLPPNTVLFVDEAYLEFVEPGKIESAIRFVREGKNVVISRTFSKIFGMAGARAGYSCAKPELTATMMNFMDNSIPILGLRAADAALGEKPLWSPSGEPGIPASAASFVHGYVVKASPTSIRTPIS